MSASSSGTSPAVTTTVPAKSAGSAASPQRDGVAGAELLVLHGDVDGAAQRRRRARSTAGMTCSRSLPTHDHEVLRRDLGDRVQGVRQHAAAGQRVQHLGDVGLHPGARAGGQDDDGGFASCRHVSSFVRFGAMSRSPRLSTPKSQARAPSPGLEPELSEPKSEVLPITPRRTAGVDSSRRPSATQERRPDWLRGSAGEGSACTPRPDDRYRAPSAADRDREVAVRRARVRRARPSRRSRSGPTSPNPSSTSTSAARRGSTPSSSTARCRRCSTASRRR